MEKRYISKCADETIRIGEKLAKELKPGDVIAFYGELGSGKTTMIKGICKGFGIKKGVKSPSFVFLRIYKASDVTLYHFDFYRLQGGSKLLDIDYDEYFYDTGIALVEWADRVEEILPQKRYEIKILVKGEDEREICISHL